MTFFTMKSRTLIELVQSLGLKPLQQSPASASFLTAAVRFILSLRSERVRGRGEPEVPRQVQRRRDHRSASISTVDLSQRSNATQTILRDGVLAGPRLSGHAVVRAKAMMRPIQRDDGVGCDVNFWAGRGTM